ncbi:hypothetical protein GS597_14110 [Synechococcales cyanobacterium C]|uniref:Uncharacterized protein n=1 Tax=Petrachloros mirabilis ULC683 TaxID=2781853 RepID=A0A8K2A1B3_9CYAN|nr:hypothetical protein [Petrachloros mirabilis]NCJ07622.1 hypothetical protein [Petrachloros mirabilis ULC683]
MSAFVGTQTVADAAALTAQLEPFQTEGSWLFLKWPHQVSGFCQALPPEFPSPEGQLLTPQLELRWKPQGQGYSLLLLSIAGAVPEFEPVGQTWLTQDHSAFLYPETETRFPRGLRYQALKLGQRYFLDAQTATVHFAALSVR